MSRSRSSTPGTSTNAASADDASHAWPARLSPPKAGSMTSGGSSSSAFVPRRWRSGARTTLGRPGGVAGGEDRGQVVGGHRGQVRGEDQQPVRVGRGPRLLERGVEAARPLGDRQGAGRLGDGEDLGVRRDHDDLGDTRRGERRGHGPPEQPLHEVAALLGVEHGAQARLGALEGADGDDGDGRRAVLAGCIAMSRS